VVTTAWDSGRHIAGGIPHGGALHAAASVLQLVALALPVLGSILVTQKVARTLLGRGLAWSEGRPIRRTAVVALAAATCAGAAWAWWPSGQYQPVHPTDNGTLTGVGQLVSSPRAAIPVDAVVPVHVAPGKYLAVSLVPVDGPSKAHPAFFVIRGHDGEPPVALVSDGPGSGATTATGTASGAAPGTTTTPGAPGTTTTTTTTTAVSPSQPAPATAFPFKLPAK